MPQRLRVAYGGYAHGILPGNALPFMLRGVHCGTGAASAAWSSVVVILPDRLFEHNVRFTGECIRQGCVAIRSSDAAVPKPPADGFLHQAETAGNLPPG